MADVRKRPVEMRIPVHCQQSGECVGYETATWYYHASGDLVLGRLETGAGKGECGCPEYQDADVVPGAAQLEGPS